ncbi:MAG TPA: endolytic transglycosylase MltG, partial [Croceibacterium sp.]|nr:endolytic transglycosylase MltG [Croceibacterium sp.]
MGRKGCFVAIGLAFALLASLIGFTWGWWGSSQVERDTAFVVPAGSSLTSIARKLEDEGLIASADSFLLRAKVLGSGDPIKAGEFLLPAGASPASILDTLQHGEAIRRFVTVPEGLPSIMVWERLNAEKLLSGSIPVPEEGSVLPESYDFERGETRAAVLARMQRAMAKTVAELWPKRSPAAV